MRKWGNPAVAPSLAAGLAWFPSPLVCTVMSTGAIKTTRLARECFGQENPRTALKGGGVQAAEDRERPMIKLSLVCDSCGAIIAEGISANEVRLESDALYRRHDGKDLCPRCEAFLLPRRTHRRQKQNPA